MCRVRGSPLESRKRSGTFDGHRNIQLYGGSIKRVGAGGKGVIRVGDHIKDV
jgi:hypothetical protein